MSPPAGPAASASTWYASAVHAIAIALTLSVSSAGLSSVTDQPGSISGSISASVEAAPAVEASVEAEAPVEPEPLPDVTAEPDAAAEPETAVEPEIAAEPEPAAEPDPAAKPNPAAEPNPIPPAGDEQALAASTTDAPAPARRDRLGCAGSRSCRRMSIAGIVVGSLGLVAIGTGIGLLVNPDEVVPELPIFVKTTHPPGLVAVTIGTGVVLTSALMIGAAHKGYKNQPNERARVLVGPTGLRF